MEGVSVSGWLSDLAVVAIGIGTLSGLLIAAGAAPLIRMFQNRRSPKKVRESGESVAQEGYLFGSLLGLLGLLLAFSFGMVLSRYEARRELVTTEANAIGTAYLRAQLLDEPHRSRLSQLLIAYTGNRIELADGGGESPPLLARNDQLLIDIWAAIRASR